MKKIISLLLSLFIILSVFTFTGCEFIDSSANSNNNVIWNNQNGTGGGSGVQTVLDPVPIATGINFGTVPAGDRTEMTLKEASQKVRRTSVTITVGGGVGSGVIIDNTTDTNKNNVYIITCHHVISGGGSITVFIPDNNYSYENADYIFTGKIGAEIYSDAVTLVGGDRVSDIAVLKIDLTKPAVSGNVLDNSKIERAKVPDVSTYALEYGETIFAIGNPGGELPGSLAEGYVSYDKERDVVVGEVGDMKLLQIGVSTNPGNSGGGLYNLYGELIGITNAGNTNYDELNFAIPFVSSLGNGFINISKHLIKTATATNYGYVPDRWSIGINITTKTSYFSDYVVISKVEEGSNADGKLKVGDIVNHFKWSFNGDHTYQIAADGTNFSSAVASFSFYSALMRTELQKGDTAIINVSRQGSGREYTQMDIEIKLDVCDFIFCDTGN